jgi:hypothetical protein
MPWVPHPYLPGGLTRTDLCREQTALPISMEMDTQAHQDQENSEPAGSCLLVFEPCGSLRWIWHAVSSRQDIAPGVPHCPAQSGRRSLRWPGNGGESILGSEKLTEDT